MLVRHLRACEVFLVAVLNAFAWPCSIQSLADDSGVQVVVAEGVGADVAEARSDAFRHAVRQVVGAYVDSETIVANDEVISDRIVTLSPAFVEKVEQIGGSESKTNGLVRLRFRAHVRVPKVLDALAASKIKTQIATKQLDATSLLAELETKSSRQEAGQDILARVLSSYPESCLTVEASGKESIDKRPDGIIELKVPLTIKPNEKAYADFSKILCQVLSATERPSGDFHVDGSRYGPGDSARVKRRLESYLSQAFTESQYMLGVFPNALQEEIRRSCDGDGNSPIVDKGPAYLLWNGDQGGGINSLEYGPWKELRKNSGNDWIVVCATDARNNYQQTTWKWFHVTSEEYDQWFAATPATFQCRTIVMDRDNSIVGTDSIELTNIGAARYYPKLLWLVPLYVNLKNYPWYTPHLQLVRSVAMSADDIARVSEVKMELNRRPPQEKRVRGRW
jgi:hypothetical protein